jgi:hypothetical protein
VGVDDADHALDFVAVAVEDGGGLFFGIEGEPG